MSTLKFQLVCLILGLIGNTPVFGQTTLHNRTPHDLWVSVGYYKASGQQFSTDDFHPGIMRTKGWYKITRYGGSTTVPYSASPRYGRMFIHVIADGGRVIRRFSPGSRSMPVRHPQGFEFDWTFPDRNGKDPEQNGALRAEARRQGFMLQRFAPISQFAGGNQYELTLQNLGWPN